MTKADAAILLGLVGGFGAFCTWLFLMLELDEAKHPRLAVAIEIFNYIFIAVMVVGLVAGCACAIYMLLS